MTSYLRPLLMRISYVEADLRALAALNGDDTSQLIARQATQHLKAIQRGLEEAELEHQAQRLEAAIDRATAAAQPLAA